MPLMYGVLDPLVVCFSARRIGTKARSAQNPKVTPMYMCPYPFREKVHLPKLFGGFLAPMLPICVETLRGQEALMRILA